MNQFGAQTDTISGSAFWLCFEIVFFRVFGENFVVGFFTQFGGVNTLVIGLQDHFAGIAVVAQHNGSTWQRLFCVTIGDGTTNGDDDGSDVERIDIVVVFAVTTVRREESFCSIAFQESDTEIVSTRVDGLTQVFTLSPNTNFIGGFSVVDIQTSQRWPSIRREVQFVVVLIEIRVVLVSFGVDVWTQVDGVAPRFRTFAVVYSPNIKTTQTTFAVG